MDRYWCYSCYGLNQNQRGRCRHCGNEIAAPATATYEEKLVWTLDHPDGDRAIVAAQTLGHRRAQSAVPALVRAAQKRDPYLQVAAVAALAQIGGHVALETVRTIAANGTSPGRHAARSALRRAGGA
jgi:HEAT repeat protein